MYSLQRLVSNGSLATIKNLSQQNPIQMQRCMIVMIHKQHSHQTATVQSKLNKGFASSSTQSSSPVSPTGSNTKGRSLPAYMVFRQSSPATSSRQSSAGHATLAWDITGSDAVPIESTTADTYATRPLVLLFAWMLSKNSQIEKYREFWIKRGYDILTVQTSPIDLLLPSIGGKRVAKNVYNFLNKLTPKYDEILVHAFSVGGYQLGEFLDRLYTNIDEGDREAERIYNAIKLILIDSVVFADDAPPGLSRAITTNPIGQPILEKSIATFLKLTKRYTFDRYKVVEAHVIGNKRNIPSKLIFSKDDVVSNYRSNFEVIDGWKKRGIITEGKCWEKSAHVLHYREHPEEYKHEVERFIERVGLAKDPKQNV